MSIRQAAAGAPAARPRRKAARSAHVHADTTVPSWTSSARSLDELAVDHQEIKIAVLENLSLDLAQKLRQANQPIGVLAA